MLFWKKEQKTLQNSCTVFIQIEAGLELKSTLVKAYTYGTVIAQK